LPRKDRGVIVPKYEKISQEFIDIHRDQVHKMAQLGCTDKEQATILGISEENLRNNFRTELSEGRSDLRRSLRRAQLESAIKDKNTTMLIWLGKNYLGQKEPKQDVAHSGGVTVERVVFEKTTERMVLEKSDEES